MASNFSVQSSQREAIRKMLSLNAASTGAEWDQVTQDDATWKVLIYDKYCRDIISPLFKVGLLKQMNVTLYMMLHSERQRIPDVPAIYFVQPTEANIDRICKDAQSGLYDSMHLNFSSELPRALMEKLADAMVSGGLDSTIDRVHDQYSNFVSLEPTLFSLGERDVFPIINDPRVKDTDISACVDRIVDGLFCVCVTLGSLPVIRCGRDGPAEMIAKQLDAKLRDHLQSRNNLFSDALSGRGVSAAGGLSRPVLVLLDRGTVDVPIMLQHSVRYQAQIHDLLAMRANVVVMQSSGGSKEVYDIDVNEPFFGENARLEFPQVAQNIEKGIERHTQKNAEVLKKTGGGADADPSTVTAELHAAIADVKKLKETKRVLDMHTEVAKLCFTQVKERMLNQYMELEDELLTDSEGTGAKVLSVLQSASGTVEDKLRLLCAYYWHCDAIDADELNECIAAVKRAGGEDHALNFLRGTKKMFKAKSSKDAMVGRAASQDSALYLETMGKLSEMAEKAGKIAKDTMGLESEQLCPVAIMVQEIMSNNKVDNDPYLYLDPHPRTGSRGSAVVRQHKPFTDAVAFAIGGGNYVEYEQVLRLASDGQRIVYGATDIVSPREFLSQLEGLGKRS